MLFRSDDKVGCIEALCDGVETLDELVSNIEKIFSDFTDDGKPKHAVVLGTVHRTKGLEAHNITMLDPEHFPHSMAKKPWERVQEKNLAYVGATRAKFLLSKDGSVVEPGRLTFVGSCPSIYSRPFVTLDGESTGVYSESQAEAEIRDIEGMQQ